MGIVFKVKIDNATFQYIKLKMKGLDVANTKVKNIYFIIITYIERITFFHGNNKK